MSEYRPDNWVVLKIKDGKLDSGWYKVLAGWSGGYLDGDSWRMNSGISEVKVIGDYIEFWGYSGSCYICHKDSYGLRMNNAGIYQQLKDNERFEGQITLLYSDTNWEELKL
jgi:hypothetical protein